MPAEEVMISAAKEQTTTMTTTTMAPSSSAPASASAPSSTTKSENRRSNKPLMEKRRRARINSSLGELKNLILTAMKKDTSRSSKLEKADILEMAVKHLQNLQQSNHQQKHRQTSSSSSSSPATTSTANIMEDSMEEMQPEVNVRNMFRAGYNECAIEVSRFLDTVDGLDRDIRSKLVGHLHQCLDQTSVTRDENNDGMCNGHRDINKRNTQNNQQVNAGDDDEDEDEDEENDVMTMETGERSTSEASSPSPASTPESFSSSMGLLDIGSSTSGPSTISSPPPPPPPMSAGSARMHIPTTSIPLAFLPHDHGVVQQQPCGRRRELQQRFSTMARDAADFGGLRLVPTRLSTGEFAFVVPHTYAASSTSSLFKEEPVWRPW